MAIKNSFSNIKVVILCGGKGTRLGIDTKFVPKPMVKIDNKPILLHILKYYHRFGFSNFILALGYKNKIISSYFKKNKFKFNVQCVDTGMNTLTGGRLLKLKKILSKEDYFMLTYGDGLTNQNLKKLEQFHHSKKKIATMTVVRPPVRFGEVKLKGSSIKSFQEKPQIKNSWINGGFFVFDSKIFRYLGKGNEMLERRPMEKLAKNNQLVAFKHKNFWQCMDTPRDKEYLKKLIKTRKAPWLN